MSIHSINPAMARTHLNPKAGVAAAQPGTINDPKKPANDPQAARGVELMHRELAARGRGVRTAQRPPELLLKHLSAINSKERLAPANPEAPKRHRGPHLISDSVIVPDSDSKRELSAQAQKSRVSESAVNAALAKLNISTITETGEPVTQTWIDEKLAELQNAGAAPPEQASSTQPYQVTVKGLLANWGNNDSIYDLTGSGTVDGEDLLMLLANGGTMTIEAAAGTEPELTLEGLLAAWGQSDSPYDFTGNGTVDGEDLLLFLQWMQGDEGN